MRTTSTRAIRRPSPASARSPPSGSPWSHRPRCTSDRAAARSGSDVLLFTCERLVPGLLGGWGRGGRVRALLDFRPRYWGLPWGAVALQVLSGAIVGGGHAAAAVAVLCRARRVARVPGGRRPPVAGRPRGAHGRLGGERARHRRERRDARVARRAGSAVGLGGIVVEDGNLWKHIEAGTGTRIAWSATRSHSPFHKVVSAGDLLMLGARPCCWPSPWSSGRQRSPRRE